MLGNVKATSGFAVEDVDAAVASLGERGVAIER